MDFGSLSGDAGGNHDEAAATAALIAPLQKRLEEPWRIGGHSYTVGAAIGAVLPLGDKLVRVRGGK